jgi:hypothetical protein
MEGKRGDGKEGMGKRGWERGDGKEGWERGDGDGGMREDILFTFSFISYIHCRVESRRKVVSSQIKLGSKRQGGDRKRKIF